jgi:4-hydroxybenzoate polyprenyltransferase
MKKSRFYRLFKGFYEQYLIAFLFMALTPAVFYNRPMDSLLALAAIMLGTAADISINRVYDADDDAIEAWKSKTNPISNGDIKQDVGWMMCVSIYFMSIILSLLSGDIIFAFAIAVRNLLGFLYSGPPIRAKSSPVIDIAFHLMIIDSGPAAIALVYTRNFTALPLYLLGFLVFNSMFTQISQEIRDFNVDRKAGLETTVQKLGFRKSMLLQRTLVLVIGMYAVIAGSYNGMLYLTAAGAIATLYVAVNILGDYKTVHTARKNTILIVIAGFFLQALSSLS